MSAPLPRERHLAFVDLAYRGRKRVREPEAFARARNRLSGPPVPPEEGIAWLARTCVERVRDRWDAVVAWTGEEGSAKSTGVLRFVEACVAYSGVPFPWANLCYGPRPMLDAYRRKIAEEVVWYDEGTRGFLADDTPTPQQKVLVQTLFQGRVRGKILVVALPDIWLLAKKLRGRRAAFWVDVVSRGSPRDPDPPPTEADVLERERRRHYEPTSNLGFSPSLRCPRLTYRPFADDDPRWVEYSRRKDVAFDSQLDEADATLDRAEKKAFGRVVSRADPEEDSDE